MTADKLTELIDAIYAATLEADGWSLALKKLAASFGCDSTAMRMIDLHDFHVVSDMAAGASEEEMALYAEHFAGVLPHLDLLKAVSNRSFAGDIFVIGEHEVVRLEFADSLVRRRVGDRYVAGFLFKVGSRIVHIAMLCHRQADDYNQFSGSLTLLVPHLQRAFQISRRLLEQKYRTDGLEQAMNHFSSGVILIDCAGAPVYLNRRARELVANMQGLNIVGNQIVGTTKQTTQRLRQMLDVAVAEGGDRIGAMTVQCINDEKIDLSMVAVPLHPDIQPAAPDGEGICAALLIGSTAFASGLSSDVLQLLYNLTGAEARLALGLADGKSLERYCSEQGIQLSTARGYLKQIFQKTATNRQPELICLLRSIPFYL